MAVSYNFASEGKCYRYGSVNMPIDMWGPWHTPDDKTEGTLISVQKSVVDMITQRRLWISSSSLLCLQRIRSIGSTRLFVVISSMKVQI